MPVTVCLTYKREWEASIPELFELAQKLYEEKGTEVNRVLREGEEKDPFPVWMRTVFKRRGYRYEWFNARYSKKVDGANPDLIAKRVEDERLWLLNLISVLECESVFKRVLKLLTFQPTSLFLLAFPDRVRAELPAPPPVADAVRLEPGSEYLTRGGWTAKPTGRHIANKPPNAPERIYWEYDHGEKGKWNHNPANGCITWVGGKFTSPQDLVAKVGEPAPAAPKGRLVPLKAAQLARVTAAYIDGIEYEMDKAEDVAMEEKEF